MLTIFKVRVINLKSNNFFKENLDFNKYLLKNDHQIFKKKVILFEFKMFLQMDQLYLIKIMIFQKSLKNKLHELNKCLYHQHISKNKIY